MQNYDYQDWKPVVLRKEKQVKQKHIDPENIRKKKIEENSEEGLTKIETISDNERKTLINLRTERKITQAVLAQQLNMRADIIKTLENGTHPKDKSLVNKIKSHLQKILIPIKETSD